MVECLNDLVIQGGNSLSQPAVEIQLCAYSRHSQPFHQRYPEGPETYIVRLQAEGESEAFIDGRLVPILPGDLTLSQPGEYYELRIGHQASPLRPSGDYYVLCSGTFVEEWWKKRNRPKMVRLADDPKIHGVWEQLILEKLRLDGGNPEVLEALLRALFSLLDRAIDEAPSSTSASANHAHKIKTYIEAHALAPLTLQEIADHAGISVTRAVHVFKSQFGLSVMQYAQQLRLAHAVRLMSNSQYTLERIAEEAGFGSYTYFHRVFRARYGIAPGQYRAGGVQPLMK
uniref:AraC family transcriptional regulator n=1 Tax=Cohnella candidum TaxID=2674991 RepID=A0A3G3K3I9_9BACL|nr:AraC family transcriptional regulator [Cohnella candidum]